MSSIVKIIGVGVILVAIAVMTTGVVAKVEDPNTVVLNSQNTMSLGSEVNGDSVSEVNKAFREIKGQKQEPIYLFLNTPGGEIQAGLEMIEALKGSGRPINTVTLFAASMGFQIAQNLGERLILKNGTLMSHRARGQVGGEFGGQANSQLERRFQFWSTRMQEMDQVTADRTNGKQSIQSYQAAYENELWLTGSQAVEGGYADRIVTVKCDASLNGVTTHSVEYMGMNVFYDLDKCPLNTAPTNIRLSIETTQGVMDSSEFINKGGKFGAACLMSPDTNKLCTLDTSFNVLKIGQLKTKFKNHFIESRNKVIYMTINPNEAY